MSALALPYDVLEAVYQPGTSDLSATGIAELFGLQLQDLAAMAAVHRNTVRTHPNTPKLQAVLRDLMRVLSAASDRAARQGSRALPDQECADPSLSPQDDPATGRGRSNR